MSAEKYKYQVRQNQSQGEVVTQYEAPISYKKLEGSLMDRTSLHPEGVLRKHVRDILRDARENPNAWRTYNLVEFRFYRQI